MATERKLREELGKITREDVERGIQKFKENSELMPPNRESTEYDIVIDNNDRFPPKESVRYAYIAALERLGNLSEIYEGKFPDDPYSDQEFIRSALPEKNDDEFNSDEARTILQNLGFSILRKNQKNNIWIVRNGSQNEFEEKCLEKGCVIEGHRGDDLTGLTKKQIKNRLQNDEKYTSKPKTTISKWANELLHFASTMSKGDKVFMPLKDTTLVAVGIIEGNYSYENNTHIRPVRWTKKAVARTEFSEIETKLRGQGTVFKVTDDFDSSDQTDRMTETNKTSELLEIFSQIILQGPPGTGKTFEAQNIAKQMTGDEEQGNRWEIIQFHPSYNYEDFVRGIQIRTENEKTVYETVNRVLVKMANKARKDRENDYVLIIDEINRANIATVLGELIYALEYRGQPVHTPYEIDGNAYIKLPENLYIIGTMNTADRTIGTIDYAVRRRFAFVSLLPNKKVVKENSETEKSVQLFEMVSELFNNNEFLSPDYDSSDVAIGHTYFLARDKKTLKNKIEYQVIPILREYAKDGIFRNQEAVEKKIEQIKQVLDGLEDTESLKEEERSGERVKFRWENNKYGTQNKDLGVGRLVLDIVRDYAKNTKPHNIQDLKKAFPDSLHSYGIVQLRDDPNSNQYLREEGSRYSRFFSKDEELIILPDGKSVMVCGEWGARNASKPGFDQFKEHCKTLGYEIEEI